MPRYPTCRYGVWLVLLLLCVCVDAYAQQRDPQVERLIEQTNLDTLISYIDVLSGNVPVSLSGSTYTIRSRQSNQPGNDLAARYLARTLHRFGLDVVEDDFSTTGTNILGIQRGTDTAASYILCAHYDSRSTTTPDTAPGADDNASGTAAVLEAARLLSRLSTEHTIVYAFWDEEENGLVGSAHFARAAAASGTAILGVINLDMIGYDGNDDGIFTIHRRAATGDEDLARAIDQLNTAYALGLTPLFPTTPTTRSDHASFWQAGYDAVLLIEHISGTGITGSDFNPFYHSPEDRRDHLNLGYFHSMSRLAVATTAYLALDEAVVSDTDDALGQATDYVLHQNYPNPARTTTTISYDVPAPAHVRLHVVDLLGREVATPVNQFQPAGRHHATLYTAAMAPGLYFYSLHVGNTTSTRKLVILD